MAALERLKDLGARKTVKEKPAGATLCTGNACERHAQPRRTFACIPLGH